MASPSHSETLGGTPEAAEFGAALRDMRMAHNADISTVASTLRIRQVYLQAIEEGRFGDLPGPTYAAGFVRAYAEYLGLEIPEVMRRYREVTRDGAAQAPLVAPAPVSEGRMPTGFILLVAAILAGVAYGSWYYLTVNGRDAGELVAQLPQRIADIVGMNRSSGETPTPSTVPSTVPSEAPAAAAPAKPMAAEQPESAPAPAPAPAPAAQPETPAGATAQTAEPAAPEPAPPSEQGGQSQAPEAVASAPPESENSPAPVPQGEAAPKPSATVTTVPLPAESSAGDAAVPSASVAATAPASGGEGGTPASAAADAPAEAAAPPQPEPAAPAAPSAPEQVAAAPPAAAAPAAAPAGPPSRVVLRATAISWVELRDAAGKRIFSRLLKKGETYNVPAKPGITLATGNAGALDILVDGRPISPIGPLGAVRRDILLEPDSLLKRGVAGQ